MKDIKNNFIHYEEAKELKELGFDDDVISAYTTDDKKLSIFAFTIPSSGIFKIGFEKGWSIRAPLWQQAFEFFREKYDFIHQIMKTGNNEYFYLIQYPPSLLFDDDKRIDDMIEYLSYEEAQLECLRELIKLIKK